MPNHTLEQLRAMSDRELDAVLAGILEPKPELPHDADALFAAFLAGISRISDTKAWRLTFDYEDGDKPKWEPVAFCSPDSPRSLLDDVEAEIERRELQAPYYLAIEEQVGIGGQFGLYFRVATAPARVRVIAAVMALEGVKRG